jgi:hypothetical protein
LIESRLGVLQICGVEALGAPDSDTPAPRGGAEAVAAGVIRRVAGISSNLNRPRILVAAGHAHLGEETPRFSQVARHGLRVAAQAGETPSLEQK